MEKNNEFKSELTLNPFINEKKLQGNPTIFIEHGEYKPNKAELIL